MVKMNTLCQIYVSYVLSASKWWVIIVFFGSDYTQSSNNVFFGLDCALHLLILISRYKWPRGHTAHWSNNNPNILYKINGIVHEKNKQMKRSYLKAYFFIYKFQHPPPPKYGLILIPGLTIRTNFNLHYMRIPQQKFKSPNGF